VIGDVRRKEEEEMVSQKVMVACRHVSRESMLSRTLFSIDRCGQIGWGSSASFGDRISKGDVAWGMLHEGCLDTLLEQVTCIV